MLVTSHTMFYAKSLYSMTHAINYLRPYSRSRLAASIIPTRRILLPSTLLRSQWLSTLVISDPLVGLFHEPCQAALQIAPRRRPLTARID